MLGLRLADPADAQQGRGGGGGKRDDCKRQAELYRLVGSEGCRFTTELESGSKISFGDGHAGCHRCAGVVYWPCRSAVCLLVSYRTLAHLRARHYKKKHL